MDRVGPAVSLPLEADLSALDREEEIGAGFGRPG